MEKEILLTLKNIVKEYPIKQNKIVKAVSDVSFDIYKGECLALVGESGCGKSTLGKLILGLELLNKGEIKFENKNILNIKGKELKSIRKKMQMVFQDPYSSMNPRMKIFDIVAEPLRTHGMKDPGELKRTVFSLLETVGINTDNAYKYPHQFSGGQRQRISIARAVALNPEFLICDEPVSALDVSIQAQILNLLKDIFNKNSLTCLFITHDLSVVRFIADRVCVMFLGKICEISDCEELFTNPKHPYTKLLLSSIPGRNVSFVDKKRVITDNINLNGDIDIPSPINPPSGCRFHTRCPLADSICKTVEPEIKNINNSLVACHHITA